MIPGNANPLLLASAAAAAAAGDSNRSLRFNSGDSAYLNRTPSSAGNRRTWTFATWIKLSKVATSDLMVFSCRVSGFGQIQIGSGGTPHIAFNDFGTFDLRTDRLMRDLSGWFHLCCVFDSTNSTSGDRARIYVNGVRETDFSTETYPSQNAQASWNRAEQHSIGSLQPSYANYFDGYMADIYFIDGSALDPVNNFIEADSNGVYQVKEYTGTYGTNGFHLLDFANESTIGHDSSGNNNDFTANNFSTTAGAGNDVLLDYPANGDSSNDSGAGGQVNGNYATFNPLDKATAGTTTISNGNLDALVQHSGTTYPAARLTISPAQSSGKYQWEITIGAKTTVYYQMGLNLSPEAYSTEDQHATFRGDGFTSSSLPGSWSGTPPSFTQGDVITVAYDAGASNCKFYKNGVLGPTFTLTSIPDNLNFGVWADSNVGYASYTLNAGQRPFAYPVTGYKSLCTTNLPTPTIADGGDYFNAFLWTGNGSDTRSLTGVGFNPDLVWFKARNSGNDHNLIDAVRGANKTLIPNRTNAETTNPIHGYLTSFDSDGFSVTKGSFGKGDVNENNRNYVAWCWDAGTSTGSNTDGSVTSQVRANQTAGVSIVTYTFPSSGAFTVGHGLNATPGLIISKHRNRTSDWLTWVSGFTNNEYLVLDDTDAKATASEVWGTSTPSSSTFGSKTGVTGLSGDTELALCFAPVEGFSQIGSYTGNGNASGPFIFTGFRPAVIIQKRTDSTGSWTLVDTARDIDNPAALEILPNSTAVEYDNTSLFDILSNGFKVRATFNNLNASSGSFIYIAFAENPFQANGGLAR